VPGRLTGLGWRDAGTLGVLMNMRGLTELIVLNVGVSMGVLDGRMYTIMVLMALVTTAAAGLIIRYRPPETGWTWPQNDAGPRLTESSKAG
jgi:Kef-type K+ transport system membrane component KefB